MSNVLPNKISAVIFDLDDTLVESTVDYLKFRTLVIDRMVQLGEDRDMYHPSETIVSILRRYEASLRSQGLPEKVIRQRIAGMDRIMDDVELERVEETVPIRGAKELLEFLRSLGVRIGVLTRGCEEYATRALARTGLLGLVDALECRNASTRPKPSPESYLKLIAALDVPLEETIFIGDHAIDAECAGKAGVPFLGVLTGSVEREDLVRAGSVEVFEDPEHLMRWLSGRIP